MTGTNDCCTDIFAVGITDPNPAIIGPLTVQIAFNGFAAQIFLHPAFCFSAGAGFEFWCINAVEAHWGAVDNDCISISDIGGSGGKRGEYEEAESQGFKQFFHFSVLWYSIARSPVSTRLPALYHFNRMATTALASEPDEISAGEMVDPRRFPDLLIKRDLTPAGTNQIQRVTRYSKF
jgi:hypothetical protein